MFGYVIPDKAELKVKEYELYKAYYCGICHSIKKEYGQLPRFMLAYDMAFLAIILKGLEDKKNIIELKKCIVNPIKKKPVIGNDSILNYCADMNVILGYYKFKDNLYDKRNVFLHIPIAYIYIKIHRKLKKYKEKLDIIESKLKELRKLEKENSKDLDLLSDKFAVIMQQIFLFPKLSSNNKKIINWLSYNLGKWVYIIDAYDDIEEDYKKNNFNPFIIKGETAKEARQKNKKRVEKYLFQCLDQASKAMELLDIKKNINIINNIIYIGLAKQTEERCND